VIIRLATAADIPAVMNLERSSTAAHWSEQQYQQLFQPGVDGPERLVLIAEASLSDPSVPGESNTADARILGFLVAHHIAPEWELENIVVTQSARRNGLGKRLFDALLTRAKETNSDSIFLEVRESNAPARALYESTGFEQTGRRKSYYATPQEDAILYRLPLR
jgi:ribosomal-protein-alanine N-acetyltransferase